MLFKDADANLYLKTLTLLECPECQGRLTSSVNGPGDHDSGTVNCVDCDQEYPILGGVLVLVSDVREYLIEHVKGISRYVRDHEIPKEYRAAFLKAKKHLQEEHIEEDLEAERVTALYLMSHYLNSNEVCTPDPVLAEVIEKYWDQGPFTKIRELLSKDLENGPDKKFNMLELGCGSGGLLRALSGQLQSYLGIDSSFASIALARQFALGARSVSADKSAIKIPDDLLFGPTSKDVEIKVESPRFFADFIVADAENPPVQKGLWTITGALNVIDMLYEPEALPQLQFDLLAPGGIAVQSSPYIWHSKISEELRKNLPSTVHDSAAAVERLYTRRGFRITHSIKHVPWVFFKNIRQLELYSVHLFFATKPNQ